MKPATSSFVCRELRLRQFRNFAELDLVFPPSGVAVIGHNGSGKTNLIEAIYYLELFRSFRGASDEQLVRFGESVFFVRGVFENVETGEVREITAAYDRSGREKRVTLGSAEPDRIGDAIGKLGIVVFSPSDVVIVAGPPGERRRFLDIVLSLNETTYLAALQRYRQVLKHRNALLRDGAAPAAIEPWSEGLIEAGARLIAHRAEWVARCADTFAERYAFIGGGQRARMQYRSAIRLDDGLQRDEVADAFRAELDRLAPRERERGVTLTGPHRDDLGFIREDETDGVDLRDFGSGGQQRTAAIALRLVEAETIRESRGCAPLTLLDDVFAELDLDRSRRVLGLFEALPGQVILTAPKPSDVEVRRGELPHWRIADGRIES